MSGIGPAKDPIARRCDAIPNGEQFIVSRDIIVASTCARGGRCGFCLQGPSPHAWPEPDAGGEVSGTCL